MQYWSSAPGYRPKLDIGMRTLRWESQRRDVQGRIIKQICELVRGGATVVVAARAGPCRDFRELGRTKDFHLALPAKFQVEDGDTLVMESHSKRLHRSIRAECLDPGLREGTGLTICRYPPPRGMRKPRFCCACCYSPATALLTFDKMDLEVARELTPCTAPQPPLRHCKLEPA